MRQHLFPSSLLSSARSICIYNILWFNFKFFICIFSYQVLLPFSLLIAVWVCLKCFDMPGIIVGVTVPNAYSHHLWGEHIVMITIKKLASSINATIAANPVAASHKGHHKLWLISHPETRQAVWFAFALLFVLTLLFNSGHSL